MPTTEAALIRRVGKAVASLVVIVGGIVTGVAILGLGANFRNNRPKSQTDQSVADKPESGPNNLRGNSYTVAKAYRHPALIVGEKRELTIEIPVQNTRNEKVTFGNLSHSCACTHAKLRKTTLEDGECTILDVSIAVDGREGDQRFTVSLIEASPVAGHQWIFPIETTIYPLVKFRAQTTGIQLPGIIGGVGGGFQLPACEPSARIEHELTVEFVGRSPEQLPNLVRIGPSDCKFELKTVGVETISPVENSPGFWTRRIPLTLMGVTPDSAGPFGVRHIVDYSVGMRSFQATVHVSGAVRATFTVSPQFLFFGTLDPAVASVVKRVTVRRTDGKPLCFKELKSSSQAVKAALIATADPSVAIVECNLDVSKVGASGITGSLTIVSEGSADSTMVVQFAALRRSVSDAILGTKE